MAKVKWAALRKVHSMLDVTQDVVSDRKRRLVACSYCRAVWHLLPDERNRKAVEIAEEYADGRRGDWELDEARQTSYSVYADRHSYAVSDHPANNLLESRVMAAQTATIVAIPDTTLTNSLHNVRTIASSAKEALTLAAQEEHPRGVIADYAKRIAAEEADMRHAALIREVFGNPFQPVHIERVRLTLTITALAQEIYDTRAFDRLPDLADALQAVGCEEAAILDHCRSPGPHVRGCWVLDVLLGLR